LLCWEVIQAAGFLALPSPRFTVELGFTEFDQLNPWPKSETSDFG
jgi:hypothetical protein